MSKPKHQDESGKPATNRGKPPHKGGYRARGNGSFFAKLVGENKWERAESPWNPGRDRLKVVTNKQKKSPLGISIASCTCVDEQQDKLYGKGKRLFNLSGKPTAMINARCSVCGTRKKVNEIVELVIKSESKPVKVAIATQQPV